MSIEEEGSGEKTKVDDIHQLMATVIPDVPQTYDDVLCSPLRKDWIKAMDEEMNSMRKNKVWTLVDRPNNANIISNKWVFVIKKRPDGDVARFKARLVARGFSQVHGFDYNETYAPVAYMPTIGRSLPLLPRESLK